MLLLVQAELLVTLRARSSAYAWLARAAQETQHQHQQHHPTNHQCPKSQQASTSETLSGWYHIFHNTNMKRYSSLPILPPLHSSSYVCPVTSKCIVSCIGLFFEWFTVEDLCNQIVCEGRSKRELFWAGEGR